VCSSDLYATDNGDKISVLNIIHMPDRVIVDHRGLDRASLRMEYFYSPFYGWGPEYVVGAYSAQGYDWTRVPEGGGDAIRIQGDWLDDGEIDGGSDGVLGGVFDSLGFSPTFAALLPMDDGVRFRLPKEQPRADGSVDMVLANFTVIGRETLDLASGVGCTCWVLEEREPRGTVHRYWVAREAPFLFRRHRDIGGPRDFVSEVLSFRPL